MTDSTKAHLKEAAETMRLAQTPLQVALAEIGRLHARIAELEAAHVMLRGTVEHLESLMPDEPSYYTSSRGSDG